MALLPSQPLTVTLALRPSRNIEAGKDDDEGKSKLEQLCDLEGALKFCPHVERACLIFLITWAVTQESKW